MSTETEIKLARYSEVAKEADAFSRVIGVRRLKPSEQAKVSGMTPELIGYEDVINSTGEKVQVPQRAPLFLAASVCIIDDALIPFPRNRGELDAIYDRLDVEGIAAAGKAWMKLAGSKVADAAIVDGEVIDPLAEAKNL